MYPPLRFRPSYRVGAIPGEAVLLAADDHYTLLEGRVCALVAPLLDGTRTADDIAAALHRDASTAEVHYVLVRMERMGLLERQTATPAAAVSSRTRQPGARAGSVRCFTDAPLEEVFRSGLEARDRATETSAACAVALAEDYLDPALLSWARAAYEAGRPHLLLRVASGGGWLGPLIVPGRTACAACLAHWLRLNHPANVFLRLHAQTVRVFPPDAGGMAAVVQRLLDELEKRAPMPLDLAQTIRRISGAGTQAHRFVARPHCACCGTVPPARPAAPCWGETAPAAAGPDTTWRRYGHLVDPLVGAVRTIRRVPYAASSDVHVYTAAHGTSFTPPTLASLKGHARDGSGGKGRSDAAARAGALCEALERYSGIFQGSEPCRRATYRTLGADAVHPNHLMLFSESQFAARERWNEGRRPAADRVPAPFDEESEIDWVAAWSPTAQEWRYVPAACCYFGHPGPERFSCRVDGSGHAAGTSLAGAVVQGFLELVERDALAIWWYNRLPYPVVNLEAVDDPYLQRLRSHHAALRRELWALDLTTDLGIPVVAAVSRRIDGPREEILLGFGAHFDQHEAACKAVMEMNQLLPHTSDGRDEMLRHDHPAATAWLETATLREHPYLAPDAALDPSPRLLFSGFPFEDARAALDACVALTQRQGRALLFVDQTRPEVGLPVAKVMVPGLRPHWRRLAPGRLYEAPLKRGQLSKPRRESEMNPIALFL